MEFYFFWKIYVVCIVPYSLDTSSLEMYVKFSKSDFSSLQACYCYRRELVFASPDRTPNKEKLATKRVAGLCATLPTGEIRIFPDGRGQLYTGLALASTG